jgi:cellulose synthase/poly-beta-1,6-N-acetylglucosamine synthase-like glycosyltransferase
MERGALTAEQRDWVLGVHERTGSSVESILVASGLVKRQYMYWVLGELWNAPYLDLTRERLDTSLLDGLDPPSIVREGWLPVTRLGPDRVLVAGMREPTDQWLAHIAGTLGQPVAYAVTTDWDLRYALQHRYRSMLLDRAALGLWQRSEEQSAKSVIFRRQQVFLAVLAALVVAALVLRPLPTAQVISAVAALSFLVFVLYKFVVSMAGARRERQETVSDAAVSALRDGDLPVYTVLVPLFREASVIGDLIENLSHLDYPADKLDILLLLEEDDTETIDAVIAAKPPQTMTVIRVPRGSPQTKPKACNVGLFFARGEFLVIYDAEDRPDPDQLKKAVITFTRGGSKLVCVQAALNYWNVWENVLTRMFTVEYSYWFDYMLPGLDQLGQPIPLGGTSNHFKTDGLRRLGGWDPFNVTEDADLGIRASALGYTVGVLDSTTYEEANRALGNWVRQRSRWIKGYMQTTLVHTRRPVALVRVAGFRAALGFMLLIAGTPVTFLFVLPMYVVFLATLFMPSHLLAELFPGWVLWVSLFNLIVGNALMIYVCMMGAFKRGHYRLVIWALLNPLYWILHSVAAYKALWQLMTRPYYWEKTAHGISSVAAPARAAAARNPGLNVD